MTLALASALRKIDNAAHQVPNYPAQANPATAHMFIINPLAGGGMDNLFATHPSTGNRVARLEALAQQGGTQTQGGQTSSARRFVPNTGPSAAPAGRRGPWG